MRLRLLPPSCPQHRLPAQVRVSSKSQPEALRIREVKEAKHLEAPKEGRRGLNLEGCSVDSRELEALTGRMVSWRPRDLLRLLAMARAPSQCQSESESECFAQGSYTLLLAVSFCSCRRCKVPCLLDAETAPRTQCSSRCDYRY